METFRNEAKGDGHRFISFNFLASLINGNVLLDGISLC